MRAGKCQKCGKKYHWPDNAKQWRVISPCCTQPLKRIIINESTELVELESAPYREVEK